MDSMTIDLSTAVREHATEAPGDLWRKAYRLADAIKVCLDRHSGLLATDPEYREAVDCIKSMLSAYPGQVARMVGARHGLLVRVA